jgi:2-(1,2-epoxy-1,2-dihydrophenyl)acetyl-CoA isomerase
VASTIDLETGLGVATITLNRPDKLNAFNAAMHAELAQALDRTLGDESIRCLLLTGSGRAFCSGQDLTERDLTAGAEPDLGAALDRHYNPLIRRLAEAKVPVIAAVNGVAAGAGANLALACDIVVAARSAGFIQAFCRIGLVPDCGGTWLLPRLAGRSRAAGLALLGDRLSAEQAESWGLIWKVVDDDRLMPESVDLARRLATQPTVALGLIKRALRLAESNDLSAQLDLERDLQRTAGRTQDYREGVAAFKEKRPPKFVGR